MDQLDNWKSKLMAPLWPQPLPGTVDPKYDELWAAYKEDAKPYLTGLTPAIGHTPSALGPAPLRNPYGLTKLSGAGADELALMRSGFPTTFLADKASDTDYLSEFTKTAKHHYSKRWQYWLVANTLKDYGLTAAAIARIAMDIYRGNLFAIGRRAVANPQFRAVLRDGVNHLVPAQVADAVEAMLMMAGGEEDPANPPL